MYQSFTQIFDSTRNIDDDNCQPHDPLPSAEVHLKLTLYPVNMGRDHSDSELVV